VIGGGHTSPRKESTHCQLILSRGLIKEEHEGSKLQLMKLRVARCSRVRPYSTVACRGANKEEPCPYRISGIGGLEKEESRSSIHELASCGR
jgi:hypothetical protein